MCAWQSGFIYLFILYLEDLPQVNVEEGRAEGAVGAWAPCVKGATDICKFPLLDFFLQEPAVFQSPWTIQGGNHI